MRLRGCVNVSKGCQRISGGVSRKLLTNIRSHTFGFLYYLMAVLTAIAIPVFTAQLEKSREATDAANLRSIYAECTASVLSGVATDATVTLTNTDGVITATKTYTMKHQKDGWEGGNAPVIGSVTLPSFNNHPAIIPEEEWAAVQEEIARRKEFRIRHHLRGMSGASASPFYSRFFCGKCGIKMNRVYQDGARRPRWQCASCGARIDDETLREAFVKAYNAVAMERERMIDGWESTLQKGSPLEKIRARQMIEITADGIVPFEIPVMTQVLLEEACLLPKNGLEFILHSGDHIVCG